MSKQIEQESNIITDIFIKRIKFYEKYYFNYDVVNTSSVKNKIKKNANPLSYGLNGIISVFKHNNSNKMVLNDLYMSRNYALNCFIPENVILFRAIKQLLEDNELTIKNNRQYIKDYSDLWFQSSIKNAKFTKQIYNQDIIIKILSLLLVLSWILFIYLTVIEK